MNKWVDRKVERIYVDYLHNNLFPSLCFCLCSKKDLSIKKIKKCHKIKQQISKDTGTEGE